MNFLFPVLLLCLLSWLDCQSIILSLFLFLLLGIGHFIALCPIPWCVPHFAMLILDCFFGRVDSFNRTFPLWWQVLFELYLPILYNFVNDTTVLCQFCSELQLQSLSFHHIFWLRFMHFSSTDVTVKPRTLVIPVCVCSALLCLLMHCHNKKKASSSVVF